MSNKECPTCLDQYDTDERRVRMLNCGHAQCTSCLKAQLKNKCIKCCICRATHTYPDVNSIPVNFIAENLMGDHIAPLVPKLHKGVCDDHGQHKLFKCTTHKVWICSTCCIIEHPRGECEIISVKLQLEKDKEITNSNISDELKLLDETENEVKQYRHQLDDTIEDEKKLVQNMAAEMHKMKIVIAHKDENIAACKAKQLKMQQLTKACKNDKTALEVIQKDLKHVATFQDLGRVNLKYATSTKTYGNWKQEIDQESKVILASVVQDQADDERSKGNLKEAVELLTDAIHLDPTNHVIYSLRSSVYATMGKFNEALEDSNVTISIKPDYVAGYACKVVALANYKRWNEAMETYEKGLMIDPNNEQLKATLSKFDVDNLPMIKTSKVCFIILSYNGVCLGMIKIELSAEYPRRTQYFLELARGSGRGEATWRGATFDCGVGGHNAPGEWLGCYSYITGNGSTSYTPLYELEGHGPDTTDCEGEVRGRTGAGWSAGFFIVTKTGVTDTDPVIGQVLEGLDILKVIASKGSAYAKAVTFTECGVTL